jgi:hypothetical protein
VLGGVLVVIAALYVTGHYLTLPGHLFGQSEYDDGVYFGSAFEFTRGLIPYRDFYLGQPPGILYLSLPFAFLAHTIGTADGLACARVVTALIAGANAFLAFRLLLQRSGVVSAIAAGLGVALFPYSLAATHTMMLEPWTVFFLLVAANMVLSQDRPRSLLLFLGGLCLGFGTLLKIWEIVPLAIITLILVATQRLRVVRFLFGVLSGLIIPALPFVIMAPHAFFRDVLSSQLSRSSSGIGGLAPRISYISGFGAFTKLSATAAVTIFFILGGFAILVALISLPQLTRTDLFVLLSGIASVAMFLIAPVFWPHYAYFSAVFLAMAAGVTLSLLARFARAYLHTLVRGVNAHRALIRQSAGAVAVLAFIVTGFLLRGTILAQAWPYDPTTLSGVIPPGSCVVGDQTSALIGAGLLGKEPRSCPVVVDSWGLDNLDSSNLSAAAYKLRWEQIFEHTGYVVLSAPLTQNVNIPNENNLAKWFAHRFTLISNNDIYLVYEHKHPTIVSHTQPTHRV